MPEYTANSHGQAEYDAAILDSTVVDATDGAGKPIPVTIPIALAPGVKVVYTTRLGGVSTGEYASCNLGGKSGEDPECVAGNRAAVAQVVGAPMALVSQVHSGTAVDIDDLAGPRWRESGCADGQVHMPVVEADGLVSAQTGIALGVFAADCLPVLMVDAEAGIIGAAHCGRRGLCNGIIASTIALMQRKGARPERIVATLGPRICADCYEVGDEIADAFDARFPGTFSLTRFGGPGIDIAGAAMQELKSAGVPQDSVVSALPRIAAATQYLTDDDELLALHGNDGVSMPGSKGNATGFISDVHDAMCTVENPLWYSHRRSALGHAQHEGRMLAFIVRE